MKRELYIILCSPRGIIITRTRRCDKKRRDIIKEFKGKGRTLDSSIFINSSISQANMFHFLSNFNENFYELFLTFERDYTVSNIKHINISITNVMPLIASTIDEIGL